MERDALAIARLAAPGKREEIVSDASMPRAMLDEFAAIMAMYGSTSAWF
jgi:hypothetical protein